MPKQDLLDTLSQLQAELAAMQEVDDPTRAELQRVIGQIERQLDQPESLEQTPAPSPDESLTTQLQDFMLSIETEHPRLTRAVNQVAAALANLGI